MTTLQKVIKYLAIAFAIFLIVTIFGAIASAVFGIVSSTSFMGHLFSNQKIESNQGNEDEIEPTITEYEDDITDLNIDIGATTVTILTGDALQVETNNPYIKISQKGEKLTLKEEKHEWLKKDNMYSVKIYVPEDKTFESVYANIGAGELEVGDLKADRLEIKLGAGDVNFDSACVDDLIVSCGAGDIDITDGTIKNADVSLGTGDMEIEADLSGNSVFKCGAGDLELTLTKAKEDYAFDMSTGLGDMTINGKSVEKNTHIGKGTSKIEVSGGVGDVEITVN